MYEKFFQLNRPPFRVTPDPEFLFLSPSHEEALASIVYGVDQRKGFVMVLGEVGLGKTTILRYYLEKVAPTRLTTAYLFNADVTFKALLDAIYRELSIEGKPTDVQDMVNRLNAVFIEEHRQGRNVVLIVDEVQNMPIETLEHLRVLSNLETSTDKLVQVVLVGQPEFADRLDLHELRQLRQRIAVRSTLSPLTARESRDYIEHRLTKAGGSSTSVFTRGALRDIVRHGRGIPRTINILCDNALVNGLGYQQKPVTARIVRGAIADLAGRPTTHRVRWAWASLAVVLTAGALYLATPDEKLRFASSDAELQVPVLPSESPRSSPAAAGGDDSLRGPGREIVAAPPVPTAGKMPAAGAARGGSVATPVAGDDDTERAAWLRKAAEQGKAAAQYDLALAYGEGRGVPRDYEQAVRWYRKAAGQGLPAAQCSLGVMYEEGLGLRRNYEQAVVWYRKAADQGHAIALFNLGVAYDRGQGVSQDLVQAYRWVSLAASRATGDEQAEFTRARETVGGRITPNQMVEAEKRAREWVAAFEKRQKRQAAGVDRFSPIAHLPPRKLVGMTGFEPATP